MDACDIPCQQQKKLKTLQDAYMSASSKAGIDPEGYEKAKIAYFSLRDGPTWLHHYKEQKAEQEADQYIRKRRQVKDTQDYHSAQQPIQEDDYSFAQKYFKNKKDKNDVEWRLFSFTQTSNWYSYLELGLTIIFSLFIIYQLLTGKFQKILNYFRGNS